MAPTPKQVEFFGKLLTDRQFPDSTSPDGLQAEFNELTPAAASAWIDKAMTLPRSTEGGESGNSTPPPF